MDRSQVQMVGVRMFGASKHFTDNKPLQAAFHRFNFLEGTIFKTDGGKCFRCFFG